MSYQQTSALIPSGHPLYFLPAIPGCIDYQQSSAFILSSNLLFAAPCLISEPRLHPLCFLPVVPGCISYQRSSAVIFSSHLLYAAPCLISDSGHPLLYLAAICFMQPLVLSANHQSMSAEVGSREQQKQRQMQRNFALVSFFNIERSTAIFLISGPPLQRSAAFIAIIRFYVCLSCCQRVCRGLSAPALPARWQPSFAKSQPACRRCESSFGSCKAKPMQRTPRSKLWL